ncbi:MAG: hypothetical protein K9K32_07420, partial [Halanaerobiales bacterium]|nr:hypothetical protein [Halanaerobiales bacterium]
MDSKSFCSWSGGKDSSLSLYKAIENNMNAKFLLNILNETGKRSRSHNLPIEVIEAQSDSLKIPLVTKKASWDQYQEVFINTLKDLKEKGINTGIFGDIDIIDHKKWEEKVCKKAKMKAELPL